MLGGIHSHSSDDIRDIIVETVPTTPFQGQQCGTSGLRKKVTEFQKPHYLENFVQSVFNALPKQEVKGCTLVLAGDGRFFNKEAAVTILRMAAANGVDRVITAVNFLASTPAVSHIIRSRKAYGGFILTASHNPGGPTEDFGIKFNISNGGPAPEGLTAQIYKHTLEIKEYYIAKDIPKFDVSKPGTHKFGPMMLEVIDATQAYADLMKTIFDFGAIKKLISRKDFTMLYDAMHGVAGPFAQKIFVEELGAPASALMNCSPLEDFGGGHPDPNLTYAHHLVAKMGLTSTGAPTEGKDDGIPDFGAANDGDADRNMILGRKFFVTPSDSVAIIAANAACIPYFKNGLKGVARSMPTSAALDRVAEAKGIKCYEVPTGWKFFGNLMDSGLLSICGEESFGTGSDHIREKDGLWAILAWLSILAARNNNRPEGSPLVSVRDIVLEHWRTYGRNYYSRYDYEQVDSDAANKVMEGLRAVIKEASEAIKAGSGYELKAGEQVSFPLAAADEFEYKDPVDGSVSSRQGIRFLFKDGSRIVFRLSGTGSVGATIRVYLEKYEKDHARLELDTQTVLKPLVQAALTVSRIPELTGRQAPTVIT